MSILDLPPELLRIIALQLPSHYLLLVCKKISLTYDEYYYNLHLQKLYPNINLWPINGYKELFRKSLSKLKIFPLNESYRGSIYPDCIKYVDISYFYNKEPASMVLNFNGDLYIDPYFNSYNDKILIDNQVIDIIDLNDCDSPNYYIKDNKHYYSTCCTYEKDNDIYTSVVITTKPTRIVFIHNDGIYIEYCDNNEIYFLYDLNNFDNIDIIRITS